MEIIGRPFLCLGTSLLLGAASNLCGADLILQKVPPLAAEQAAHYPQNLARLDLGARVETATTGDEPAPMTLISGDPAAAYPLGTGVHTILISLDKIEHVDSVAFINADAKGTVAIETANANLAPAGAQWRDAGQRNLADGAVTAKIGPGEAKYVRLTFRLVSPGSLSRLGVYAAPSASDFTVPRPRQMPAGEVERVNYNLTDLHTKARVLYVSSGDDLKLASNMIDDQPGTVYTFAANDNSPTAIVDLGHETALHRVSVLSTSGSGTLNFYVLYALPVGGPDAKAEAKPAGAPSAVNENAWIEGPAMLPLSETALAALKTVGSATDNGSGRVSVEFPETSGRYLMVKWTGGNANVSVAEIAVFGRATPNLVFAANRALERSSNKNVVDGKDAKDFKEEEVPAEGPPEEGPAPSLPQPPPFVFIPQILPTSP